MSGIADKIYAILNEACGHRDEWSKYDNAIMDIAEKAEAENERLRALLTRAINMLDYAQSGYISGCRIDMEWDEHRDAFLADVRALEQ
jgi:hypothetical protein